MKIIYMIGFEEMSRSDSKSASSSPEFCREYADFNSGDEEMDSSILFEMEQERLECLEVFEKSISNDTNYLKFPSWEKLFASSNQFSEVSSDLNNFKPYTSSTPMLDVLFSAVDSSVFSSSYKESLLSEASSSGNLAGYFWSCCHKFSMLESKNLSNVFSSFRFPDEIFQEYLNLARSCSIVTTPPFATSINKLPKCYSLISYLSLKERNIFHIYILLLRQFVSIDINILQRSFIYLWRWLHLSHFRSCSRDVLIALYGLSFLSSELKIEAFFDSITLDAFLAIK